MHLAASAGEAGERYECDPHSLVVNLKARDRDVDAALEEVIRAEPFLCILGEIIILLFLGPRLFLLPASFLPLKQWRSKGDGICG